MRLFIALIATAAFGFAIAEEMPAVAGEKCEKECPIEKADANKDGALSADELASIKSEKCKGKLVSADTNKDGALDKAEIDAFKAACSEKCDKAEKAEHKH